MLLCCFFFFNDTATTEIYTFPYTTLFRSLLTIVAMTFWTGFLVRTYAWLVIFGSKGPVVSAYQALGLGPAPQLLFTDRKSTRLNSSHSQISYAVFCLTKKTKPPPFPAPRT